MITEFLQRIGKETRLTFASIQEFILAIAERVNRKTQALILHGHAATLHEQMEATYEELGSRLYHTLSNVPEDHLAQIAFDTRLVEQKLKVILSEGAARVRLLKKEVMQVDRLIQEIDADALQEDLFKLQHDLITRNMMMRRVVVAPGAAVVGRHLTQLGLPSTIVVTAIFRGPVVISCEQVSYDRVVLKTGDIVILLGPRDQLKQVLPYFAEKARASV